ncbi:MAG: uroporphyrinogen-III synthase [Terriglobales bacterium]
MSRLAAPEPGAGPLLGRRVVVTRAAAQARELTAQLEAAGAEVLALPVISIAPPADAAPLRRAVRRASQAGYDGYIFTSQNGVDAFFAAAAEAGLRLAGPHGWVGAIGSATARRLRENGWAADIVPPEFVAESVVAALAGRELAGQRILLPRAAAARDVIPQALTARGARVEVVAAYQTVAPAGAAERAQALFPPPPAPHPDAVLLTSSSTARNLAALLGGDYRQRLAGVLMAAIGPVTAATLRELGLQPGVVAGEFTAAGLAATLVAHYRAEPGG